MPELMELREKQQEHIAKAREVLDQITPETDESRAQELETQYDRFMAEVDKIESQAERQRKLDEAERRLADHHVPTPSMPSRTEPVAEARSYREIFADFIRGAELSPEDRREMRAQAAGTDTAGGYTVPTEFSDDLMASMKLIGPMIDPGVTYQLATTTGARLEWPTMDDTSNKGALLSENTQDSTSNLTFGQKTLDAYKYTSGTFQVSEELLQDSGVDIEGIVRNAMAERIGRIVNEHMTTGTGSNQPHGIVTASALGTTATAAASIDSDEILDLYHALDPRYRAQPLVAWMFNDSTLKALRKLKDGNGNYLWQAPDLRTGTPGTLLDVPYAVNPDMPDIATGAKPIVFGDMYRYKVRRVREFAVRRMVERFADYYQIGFVGFGRFDGELIDDSAVKHLVMA